MLSAEAIKIELWRVEVERVDGQEEQASRAVFYSQNNVSNSLMVKVINKLLLKFSRYFLAPNDRLYRGSVCTYILINKHRPFLNLSRNVTARNLILLIKAATPEL